MNIMNLPELHTQRLLLRAFDLCDAPEVNRLASNYNVAKTTLNIPHPYSVEMATFWIGEHAKWRDEGSKVVFALELLASNQLVGTVGLHDITGSEAEMGYWIGEPYWGQGYCTEAVKALFQFAFEQLGINKIRAEHLSANPASGKVMINAGMTHMGSTQSLDRDGNMADIELYEIDSYK